MPDTGCIVSGINKDSPGVAPALAPAFGIPEGAHCLGKRSFPGQPEVLKGRV